MVALLSAAGVPRSFSTVISLETTSEESANVSMGDLDGDGDLDLVLAKGRHTPLVDRVLLNDGSGSFVASDLGPIADRTYTAALADVDGDGDLDVLASNDTRFIDLAVPSRDGGQSYIYFNDGKAGFARRAPFGPPDAAARVGAAADFNGDGSVDLGVGDEKAASMVIYQNDGKGHLTAAFRTADQAKTPYAIAAGDLNDDGTPDIVLGYTSGPHAIFFNDGTGRQFTQVPFGDSKGAAYGFALGDIDGDRFPDIALTRSGAPNVLYLGRK
jgi:hypothetical protein